MEAAAAAAEELVGDPGAAGADGLQGGVGAGQGRIEGEVAIIFEELEAALEFGEEKVNLGKGGTISRAVPRAVVLFGWF